MEDIDESDEWFAHALTNPALPAHVLFCFQHPSKRVPWRQLADLQPAPLPEDREVPAGWGSRGRRSRMITLRVGDAKAEKAAGERAETPEMRGSPMTPMCFRGASGSGSSESGVSGAEEGSTAGERSAAEASTSGANGGGGRETKVVPSERTPTVFRIPSTEPIRRPVKKKTIPELQAVEESLLQQRRMLQKEVEAQRMVHEGLVIENKRLKRLKLSDESQRVPPSTAAPVAEEGRPEQFRPCDGFARLPDLNVSVWDLESNVWL